MTRHRLNYGCDRDANRALHMIAVCRLRCCDRTRAYAQRRTAEGKTQREIIRCSSATSRARPITPSALNLADLDAATPRPRQAITITCSAGFIGHSRRKLRPPHLTSIGTSGETGGSLEGVSVRGQFLRAGTVVGVDRATGRTQDAHHRVRRVAPAKLGAPCPTHALA